MNNLSTSIVLATLAFFLVACGDSTTDEPLPEGTAPGEAERKAVDPAASEPAPQLSPGAVSAVEQAPPLLPLPTPPVAQGDAERRSISGLSYVLPKGWAVGGPKKMRLLTLLPPNGGDSDLSISRWPGDVGGFALNVQRWARQAGLSPMTNLTTAAASDYQKFQIDGTEATWIPLVNEDTNYAILAVWVPMGVNPESPDQTWTFKLTCKADQVQAYAPDVRAFCESVKFEN